MHRRFRLAQSIGRSRRSLSNLRSSVRELPISKTFAAGALGVTLLSAVTASAAMPRREPPLILGGARPPTPKQILRDPRLPTGAAISSEPRPAAPLPVCSALRPLCVHGLGNDDAGARSALSALEAAYDRLVSALGLPAPRPDRGAGGSDALDVYITTALSELEVVVEPPDGAVFSEASAFCRLPVAAGAVLARWASLCVGEAIAAGLDASETPHLRRAFATWLWWATGEPTSLDLEAIDAIQANPQAPIGDRERSPLSEGAALFFEYLESVRSASAPGQLSAALFSASVSNGRGLGLDYVNDPDLFDVLRHSLDEEPDRFAALMIDFSVARAFVGSRDDGLHLPLLGWAGSFGRVRYDWSIPFSSLPRRVLVSPPIDSSGSVLLYLDLDEVGFGAALGFHAEWERPVNFQWQLVKVAPDGSELGRIDVPFQQRAHEADARISNLEGASAILVVGTNLEGIDLSHPFDPDVAPFEPHGATVYLVRM